MPWYRREDMKKKKIRMLRFALIILVLFNFTGCRKFQPKDRPEPDIIEEPNGTEMEKEPDSLKEPGNSEEPKEPGIAELKPTPEEGLGEEDLENPDQSISSENPNKSQGNCSIC